MDRFGERAVARTGGLITAVGMGTRAGDPERARHDRRVRGRGLGIATVVPAAMRAADELPGLRAGTGLTVLTWLMRVGFVAAPLIVGVVADATSLRVGLLVVPLAGLAVVASAGVLSGRRAPTRS